MQRRQVLVLTTGLALPCLAASQETAWAALKQPGSIVLFRHALAPGGGDPPGFDADDCNTQRNLNDEGRAQAQRMGLALRDADIDVQAVWHSAWCRTRDTAQLAFPDMRAPALRVEPAFNSFFDNSTAEPAQTAAARQLLLNWHGPGTLVVITHQVNITALTDIVPKSGEGVVLQVQTADGTKELLVKGRLTP